MFNNDAEDGPLEKKGFQKDLYNKFREDELAKCAKDPMYFIRNYVKIEDTQVGEVPFEPFEYQKEIIEGFHNHKNTVCLVGRQMGKCVFGDTVIKFNGSMKKISSLINLSFKEKIVNFLEKMLVKLS